MQKIICPGWLNPLLVFYFSRFPKQIQVTSVHSWPSISLRDVLRSAELNKKPQPQPPLSYWRVRRMPNYTIYITWWHIIHCWVYGFAVNPTTPTSHRAVSDSLLSGWSERWWPFVDPFTSRRTMDVTILYYCLETNMGRFRSHDCLSNLEIGT